MASQEERNRNGKIAPEFAVVPNGTFFQEVFRRKAAFGQALSESVAIDQPHSDDIVLQEGYLPPDLQVEPNDKGNG